MFVYAERHIKITKSASKLETLHKLQTFRCSNTNMGFNINILCCCLFGSFGLFWAQNGTKRSQTTWPMIWSHTCFENYCRSLTLFLYRFFFRYIFARQSEYLCGKIYTSEVISKKTRNRVCIVIIVTIVTTTTAVATKQRLFTLDCVFVPFKLYSWFMPTKYQNFLLSLHRIE